MNTHHAAHRARDDVVHQVTEEGLLTQVAVVGLRELLGALEQLQALQLEALSLEATNDVTHLGTVAHARVARGL